MLLVRADKPVEEDDKAEQGPDRPSTPSADEFYSARYKLCSLKSSAELNSCSTAVNTMSSPDMLGHTRAIAQQLPRHGCLRFHNHRAQPFSQFKDQQSLKGNCMCRWQHKKKKKSDKEDLYALIGLANERWTADDNQIKLGKLQ